MYLWILEFIRSVLNATFNLVLTQSRTFRVLMVKRAFYSHLTTSSSLHFTFSTFYIRNFHAWLIRSIMFLGQLINSQWGFNHTSYNITGHNQFAKKWFFSFGSLSISILHSQWHQCFQRGELSWWACPCLPWSSCWWEKGKMKEIQFHPHIIPCTISYNCK